MSDLKKGIIQVDNESIRNLYSFSFSIIVLVSVSLCVLAHLHFAQQVCVYSSTILTCLCLWFCPPGDTEWLPGQELSLSPWDLVRKPLSQCITIRLKGTNLATTVCVHPAALSQNQNQSHHH